VGPEAIVNQQILGVLFCGDAIWLERSVGFLGVLAIVVPRTDSAADVAISPASGG
jgi:hypothetical protein